jgi:oxazoline/thiazoline synthase
LAFPAGHWLPGIAALFQLLRLYQGATCKTPMLRRPQFRPHLRVEVIEGEGVFLLSEMQQMVLQGSLYELVVPYLNGRAAEEICEAVWGRATPAEVFYTLNQLEQRGVLCESEPAACQGIAYWTAQGLDPAIVSQRLGETTVALKSFGVDSSHICELLRSLHIRVAERGDLDVVLTDHYLRPELETYNQEALRAATCWLLVKPVGLQIWVGPVFRPERPGCWRCLARRLRSNFPVLGYFEHVSQGRVSSGHDSISTPATTSMADALVANAVAAWVVYGGTLPFLEGQIETFDTVGWKMQSHVVLHQPACPACGTGERSIELAEKPIVLQSCKRIDSVEGGHRARSPEETLRKYRHLISPVCGAVTMLEPFMPSDNGVMHVYLSGNNVARGPRSLLHLRTDLRSMSCGKGTNSVQAQASALCEGVERYCGLLHGDEPRRIARSSELGAKAIHPNACMLFSQKQYAERERQTEYSYHWVPVPFDPQRSIEWTPLWSLTAETVRYLPTRFCYYHGWDGDQPNFCVPCSNGNAAGNTLEEAIVQGLFELVERDGVALWWYNRLRLPGVDLASFNEPYLERLTAFYRTHQRELWVLDLTSDLEIPVFVAISRRVDEKRERIMLGFGAHLDAKIALLRAVTELNQLLVPLLLAAPDKPLGPITDRATLDWLENATVALHPYLAPREGPLRTASSFAAPSTDDLKEDVLACKGRLEQHGLELLVLDQTRPEIGMPVVKVVVPGLRHFWARFAPGRLYDVPVACGWLAKPHSEDQLNPTPMFL